MNHLLKKLIYNRLLFAILVLHSIGIVSQEFSVVTWNILGIQAPDLPSFMYSHSKFDFTNGKTARFQETINKLKKSQADIICLQEVLHYLRNPGPNPKGTVVDMASLNFNGQLAQGVNGYQEIFYQQKGSNSGVSLYCKKSSQLMSIAQGGFETKIPVPGQTNTKDSACAWAIFESQTDPAKKVLICSVHIGRDNDRKELSIGDQAWSDIVGKLKPILQGHACSCVVFAGDFNTFYEEVRNHTQQYLSDLLRTSIVMFEHTSWTANGNIHFNFQKRNADLSASGKPENFEFSGIDHVLYSDNCLTLDTQYSLVGANDSPYQDNQVEGALSKVNYAALHTKVSDAPPIHMAFPSDHLPVLAMFEFKQPIPGAKAAAASAKTMLTPAAVQRSQLEQALELATLVKKR